MTKIICLSPEWILLYVSCLTGKTIQFPYLGGQRMKILIVDNEERMCKLIKGALELASLTADMAFSGAEAIEKLNRDAFDLVITDLKMEPVDGMQVLEYIRRHSPGTETIMMTAYATQDTALEAMQKGANDYLIKPFKMDELILRVKRIMRQKELEQENRRLRQRQSAPVEFPGIVGKSKKMQEVFRLIQQVSASDAAVHIRGESGTGKELVARAIHNAGARKEHPFVAVNCAALPENLLESELFGYEPGAFTGANKRKAGLFEQAQNGTVFLDEIGDLPLSLQAKLLRVLQNNEITHLGGSKPIKVNFRLITATHRNLEEMIEQQQFRSDLYYRINIFPIHLPPLRERKEDIPELIQYFLQRYPEKSLSLKARQKLMAYDYPGNVRELENVLVRAAIVSDAVIEDVDLPQAGAAPQGDVIRTMEIPDEGIVLDELERRLIESALRKAGGNKTRAAELLGITRRRLYSMMERFGIKND
ncbi:MAG TPA: sigma-54-dependent Fis family transcriptional regulator [Caldithrix abyssi]|uniref:Sigma-54-dependent Fis family transcriptional regulator n=1 Tax=Caldithrix abyssi TaxID=187145 RepID=A0A7V5PNN4_CALAY|nr:sigma-54-dependent Fis family transcriptional regulator [Caldithrix abyssi]